MTDSVTELRQKARHCRELADLSREGAAKVELAKMAAEFDDDAGKLERKSILSEGRTARRS